VLVKQTIRAVSQTHGLRASFAPVVVAGVVGNGFHLHLSPWSDDHNLFYGGDGPYGVSQRGESILAGLPEHLPALCAIGAPSVSSYLRLVPKHWAAPYHCWGRENREAALRFITGTGGRGDTAANAGAVVAIAAATADAGLRLPPEVTVDPADLPPESQPPRLPRNLSESVERLQGDDILPEALGEPLLEAILAVRRAEIDLFAGQADDEIAAALRWRH
jgi:glutamine synthetase